MGPVPALPQPWSAHSSSACEHTRERTHTRVCTHAHESPETTAGLKAPGACWCHRCRDILLQWVPPGSGPRGAHRPPALRAVERLSPLGSRPSMVLDKDGGRPRFRHGIYFAALFIVLESTRPARENAHRETASRDPAAASGSSCLPLPQPLHLPPRRTRSRWLCRSPRCAGPWLRAPGCRAQA